MQVGDTIIATSFTPSLAVYNITVDVIRMTEVNTALGIEASRVTLIANMPSHIKWKSGGERILFNKETYFLDAVLHCRKPAGVTIRTSDKIVYNDQIYEIVDMYDMNNLGKLLVIDLRKVA